MKESPSVMFMYQADWQFFWVMCESLSRDLKPQVVGVTPGFEDSAGEVHPGAPVLARIPLKGASLTAYIKAFGSLGMTEADRLRLKIEAPPVEPDYHLHPVEDGEEPDTGVVSNFAEARERMLNQEA